MKQAASAARLDTPNLLKLPDAAGLLNVSLRTVRRLVGCGALSALHVGRAVRVKAGALYVYMTEAARRCQK